MPRLSHRHANARSSASVLTEAPTPRRDRSVSQVTVPCPTCGRAAGESCTTADGSPVGWKHKARRRMALRAERAVYSVADVQYAARTSVVERRATLKRAGITLRALATMLDVDYRALRLWFETGQEARGPIGPKGALFGAWLRKHAPATPPPTDGMNPYDTSRIRDRVDLAAIAEWNAKQEATRRAYYEKPNACTLAHYHGSY